MRTDWKEKIRPLLGQMVRFGAVGFLNTGIDFLMFTLCLKVFLFPELVSQAIGYSCGVINSFFVNRAFTFRARHVRSIGAFSVFVLINLVSLGVSVLALYALRNTGAIGVYPAKIVATIAAWTINFTGSRWIVFGKMGESHT